MSGWTIIDLPPSSERSEPPADVREFITTIEQTPCCCCGAAPAGLDAWAVLPPAEAAALLVALRMDVPFQAVCRICSNTRRSGAIERKAEAAGSAALSAALQRAVAAQARK